MRKIAQMAACLAVAAMLVPTGILQAAEHGPKSKTTATDVILVQGTLTGQYVNSAGMPVDGAAVTVRRGGEQVAATTTDAKGIFQASGLKGGVYEVATPTGTQFVRTWEANVAPPTAKRFSTIVAGRSVRGQILSGMTNQGLINAGLIAGVVVGISVGAVAYNEAKDDDDDAPTVDNALQDDSAVSALRVVSP